MPNFKIIISNIESGKSTSYEIKDQQANAIIGLSIGNEFDGSLIGVNGTIKITGGSDKSGFPMRNDILGSVKKHVLLTKGTGFRSNKKGEKRRKLVRGTTITDDIFQINGILVKK